MRISSLFNLNKTQAELDFVDIDPDEDLPLFLDPFFLSHRTDNWSYSASRTLKSFFQTVVDLIRTGDIRGAKELFDYLHEPNSTCLGLSQGKPRGRGVGTLDTDKIFNNLIKSKAIQSGLVQDIEDNILFVEKFGKDKLSDMATNILTKHLIEYTQAQCKLHNIPMQQGINSGFYWDSEQAEWESTHTEMLVYDGKKIILIPKGIVSFSRDYTPDRYYNRFVLEFLRNEHLRLNTALVHKRKSGKKFVTKKDLKEEHPMSKEFLRKFSKEHPDVLAKFKLRTRVESLNNIQLTRDIMLQIGDRLISDLRNIPSGTADASKLDKPIKVITSLRCKLTTSADCN